jgi:molybdopterin-guanine dinucleotide biosynthesis protein A
MTASARRRCTGAILAGGQSSRMDGVPKGLLEVAGLRLIDRVAESLRRASDDVILVANDPGAGGWLPGVKRVTDARPGLGALSGIHAALQAADGDLLIVAWDTPFVPGELLRALRTAGESQGGGMVAPASGSPWGFEPLCVWLGRDALGAVEALLDAGDGRTGALGERLALTTVDASSWGNPDDILFNVNTPADLARAAVIAARLSPWRTITR